MNPLILIGGALLLDAALGDPSNPLHPTRLMGKLAAAVESGMRRLFRMTRIGDAVPAAVAEPRRTGRELSAGFFGWFCVVGAAAGSALAFIALARLAGRGLGGLASGAAPGPADLGGRIGEGLASVIIVYFSIAPRDLAAHALRVRRALESGGLEGGRRAVSMIVGRDTDRLDEAGVVRACVESVAESAVDGVAAPLFWAVLFGPAGAFAYRAVNTLDSSWGYKDDNYLYFGRCAARADDAANWLPARLAFLAAAAAALVLGLDARGALVLGWRDRRKHESPNAAWLEASFAGALGIRLGGPAWYGGERLEKPFLGEDSRPPELADIGRAVALMYLTTLLCAAAWTALRLCLP